MTQNGKAVLRSVRLDDDIWEMVKAMPESLNQYLRRMLDTSKDATVIKWDLVSPATERKVKQGPLLKPKDRK